MKDDKHTNSEEDVEETDEVEEMIRWEEDGGQNVDDKYEWLPSTDESQSVADQKPEDREDEQSQCADSVNDNE